jgi:hypothetical protein
MVRGSMGQMVLHPLLRHTQATQAEIRQLEDRFGLFPRVDGHVIPHPRVV